MTISIRQQRLAIVGALLLWCTALIWYRIYLASGLHHTIGEKAGLGLLWNLFLATVPLLWSSAFQTATIRQRPVWAGIFFCLWLLFLPNAPYILTDLIHLAPRPHVPLWFILALLLSCAGTGAMLGYLSILDVHAVVEEKFSKTTGWAVAISSLLLCAFGIYLGRFLRWNSWDALANPLQLLRSIVRQFIDPSVHPHPLGVTVVFGLGLILGYLALRVVALPNRSQCRTA